MALFNSDGRINVTVVDGSTYVGAYAADGSMNVQYAPGTSHLGATAASGAMYVTLYEGTGPAPRYAPDGSVYVVTSATDTSGALRVNGLTSSSEAIDVLVVAGQSNAYGQPPDTSIPGGYTADSNVLAWNGTDIVTYAPNTVTGLEFDSPAPNWSAELNYVRAYRTAYPTSKIAVFRYTASGTQLGSSGSSATNDWHPDSPGEFFDRGGAQLTNFLAALTAAGYTPTIRLMWWMQGEADASTTPLASVYGTNLPAFIAAVRDPAKSWKIPSTAPIIIGRVSLSAGDVSTNRNTVRDVQQAVCEAKVGGNQVMMDTDGFTMSGMHYNNEALLTLGTRLWDLEQQILDQPTADAYTPVNSELTSYISRCTNLKPNLARRQLLDTLISNGKANGWFNKLDCFYVLAAHDPLAALLNLKQNAYNLTKALQPVFTYDRGFRGGAATIYLQSGFTPSTAGGQYLQDSACLFVWSRSDTRANASGMIGNVSGAIKATINPWNGTAVTIGVGINSGSTQNTGTQTSAEGLHTISRTSSANYSVWRNGTKITTSATASSGLPDTSFRILTDTSGTNTRQAAIAGWGAGLSDAEVAAMYTDLSTYINAIGAQWVPVAPTVTAPTISGTRTVGSVLTASSGTVTGEPTPVNSWQWKSGTDNVGTNATTYTQQASDVGKVITVVQTVTSSSGTASNTSAAGAATT